MNDEIYQNISEWMTPKEAAQVMGVNVRSIYTWIGRGDLEATRDRRSVRISRTSLQDLQQRRSMSKVVSEVVQELNPHAEGFRKREVSSAVFLALAGLQSERQHLIQQVSELQTQAAKDAYSLGQLEEKLHFMDEMEGVIEFLRNEQTRLQVQNKKLLNALTIIGIVMVVLVFILAVVLFILAGVKI